MFYRRLSTCFLALVLLLYSSSTAQTESISKAQRERIPQAVRDAADEKSYAIEEELEELNLPEWAGDYYTRRGLGFDFNLIVSPTKGFVYTWHGCLGLYSLTFGRVIAQDGFLNLVSEYTSDDSEERWTVAKFYPVRWGELHYLIGAGEMIDFCNAVNGGIEPYPHFGPQFLLKKGDEEKKVEGLPEVPVEYQEYLLAVPINATITAVRPSKVRTPYGDVELSQRIYPVTLNVGEADGVKVGMKLHTFEPRNLQPATILKVRAHSSIAEIVQVTKKEEAPQIGWKLSTKVRW